MRDPLVSRLRRSARSLGGELFPRPLILLYHRVTELRTDPFALAVTTRHFLEHLEVLREIANPISLGQLLSAVQRGRLPRGGVVVTFDDGYADSLQAVRLLERAEVPATIFIATSYLGGLREFWWDELEGLLFIPKQLPSRLPDEFGTNDWNINGAGWEGIDREVKFRNLSWRYEDQKHSGPRQHLYRSLYPSLQRLPIARREAALETLRRWTNLGPLQRTEYRTLNEKELQELSGNRLVEIGAHTQNHPWLPCLPEPEQLQEIHGAKTWLEDRLGKPVIHFSYPYGAYDDISSWAVREAGFRSAATSNPRAVTRDAPLTELPRVCPGDWDGQRFAVWLRALMRS